MKMTSWEYIIMGRSWEDDQKNFEILTHWGRVTHICVSELTIITSDNGLSPGRRQAIIWNNAGLLLIEPLGTNFSEISIGIQAFSFKKMHLNMSSAKWRQFCLGLNVLKGASVSHSSPCTGLDSSNDRRSPGRSWVLFSLLHQRACRVTKTGQNCNCHDVTRSVNRNPPE